MGIIISFIILAFVGVVIFSFLQMTGFIILAFVGVVIFLAFQRITRQAQKDRTLYMLNRLGLRETLKIRILKWAV